MPDLSEALFFGKSNLSSAELMFVMNEMKLLDLNTVTGIYPLAS